MVGMLGTLSDEDSRSGRVNHAYLLAGWVQVTPSNPKYPEPAILPPKLFPSVPKRNNL
jgi:hypothetical protein